MSPAKRRGAIGAALVLTLVATWYAPAEEAIEMPAPRASVAARDAARRAPPAALDVLAIRARTLDEKEEGAGLFAPAAWTAEPPAEAVVAVPAAPVESAPQAPPLPFTVMGSHEQAGQTTIFLQHHDRTHVVRVGDTVAESYKVERIDGTAMTLRYLPLDQVQTLELGRTLKEK